MERELLQQLYLLAESLERQQAVAVLGAGVSTSSTISSNLSHDQENTSIPLGSNLVKLWSKSYREISENQPLPEAAFLIKQLSGRNILVRLIQESCGKNILPLISHHNLAKLPFIAYVSFNFDELLERALNDAGRIPYIIVDDKDVCMPISGNVQVIKPHGTISRPESILIASDEIIDFRFDNQLLEELLRITMVQRHILYLGFSLKDPDFILLHRRIVKKLGEFSPKATAVVLTASDHEKRYWKEEGINIIEMDLNDFLNQLDMLKIVGDDSQSIQIIETEPWLEDPVFQKLLAIRSLPSETQVIEALLDKIEEETIKTDPKDIFNQLEGAMTQVLRYRPNYAAFSKVKDQVNNLLKSTSSRSEFQHKLSIFRKQRRDLAENLAIQSMNMILENDKIFLYSQSKRVIEGLKSVTPAVQQTCTIYISECRPKSPISFQDAYATYIALQGTQYKLRLVPDIVFIQLIDQKEVNKVIMGAHQLCEINGEIKYFVNTCGSLAIALLSKNYSIKVIVIAEKDKIQKYSDDKALCEVSRQPEENLTKSVVSELSRIRSVSSGLKIQNYGYDIVPIFDNIILIS